MRRTNRLLLAQQYMAALADGLRVREDRHLIDCAAPSTPQYHQCTCGRAQFEKEYSR